MNIGLVLILVGLIYPIFMISKHMIKPFILGVWYNDLVVPFLCTVGSIVLLTLGFALLSK